MVNNVTNKAVIYSSRRQCALLIGVDTRTLGVHINKCGIYKHNEWCVYPNVKLNKLQTGFALKKVVKRRV